MNFSSYTFFLLIVLISCSPKTKEVTFTQDLSSDTDGNPAFGFNSLAQKIKLFNVEDASKGYDSILIRVWFEPQLLMVDELIELKLKSNKWEGKHISIQNRRIEGGDSIIQEKFQEKITPKTSWENLYANLNKNDIVDLPTMQSIEGLVDYYADGVCYYVEISTNKKYKFYSYHLPEYFQKDFKEAQKMVQIIKILESEFNLKSYLDDIE